MSDATRSTFGNFVNVIHRQWIQDGNIYVPSLFCGNFKMLWHKNGIPKFTSLYNSEINIILHTDISLVSYSKIWRVCGWPWHKKDSAMFFQTL